LREPPPGRCKITINEVIGEGGVDIPASIHVSGTALGCKKVEVTLSCRGGKKQSLAAADSTTGEWTADFRDIKDLECRCNGPVTVIAQCTEDPNCQDRFESKQLPCKRPGRS
jgi:hypothetical protein